MDGFGKDLEEIYVSNEKTASFKAKRSFKIK